ncbi:putative immunoglobulin-blocking virulence protein [Mycoplasmopsis glycophila]|uniref:Immunoglobulin-blocking virulence protein n=1 Tax=Mycoplasmopsis glycophila TaxID=171285 RepID=A0A449AUJ9_9BACT|nr:putative immunoglobulin-blocking virulence protein [Mycoplasmopsis glycophila]VEU70199.1 Uncharacterised protein [Mycoplasmopsis glycophila]
MIKAKKNKILKSILVAGTSLLVTGVATSGIYFTRQKSDVEKSSAINAQIVEPTLIDGVLIVIKPGSESLADQGFEEIKVTTINLVEVLPNSDKKTLVSFEIETTSDKEVEYDITDKIPDGYELDPELNKNYQGNKIVVQMGETNEIYLRAIKVVPITIFEFYNGNQQIGDSVSFQLESVEELVEKYKSLIPEGYKLKTNEDGEPIEPNIAIGELNRIEIEPIHKEYRTTISYLDKATETPICVQKDILTIDDAKVNPNNYLPNGYEFLEDLLQPQPVADLVAGKEYIFYIRKTPIENSTTIIYALNGIERARKVFITYGDNSVITLEKLKLYKPNNLEIAKNFDPNTIIMGSENIVPLEEPRQKDTTKLIFKEKSESAEKLVLEKTITEFVDVQINLNAHIPNGYKLAPSQTDKINRGVENTIYVVSTLPPKVEEKPTVTPAPTPEPEPKPEPTPVVPKEEKTPEITEIISEGGALINPENERYEKPTTMPNVERGAISGELLKSQRAKMQSIRNILSKLSSDPNYKFNAEDLRPIYDTSNLSTEDANLFFERLSKLLNGATLKELGTATAFPYPDLTAEQQKISFQNQMNAYLEKADEYLAKGQILVFGTDFTNPYPRWGFASDDDNPAYVRQKELAKKRGFAHSGTNAKYGRNGDQLAKGDYPGWSKKMVTDRKYYPNGKAPTWKNDSSGRQWIEGSGISVWEYTPNDDNFEGLKQGKQKMAFMDASNPNAVREIISFLNKHPEITGLFIKNIGTKNPDQDITDILRDIPSQIKNLSLGFDTQKILGLGELRNKTFTQVELLTSLRNADDNIGDASLPRYNYGWGIDPIAFQNVSYVAHDWIATKGWDNQGSSSVYYGPIQFNVIRPGKDTTWEDVKKGFDLVLDTKKDWRVFNGQFGDQGYPIKIDLSETQFTSLKEINLRKHKFRVIKLPSSGSKFTLNIADLGKAQYSTILAAWGPTEKPKIIFADSTTSKIHLKGTLKDLKSGGKWVPELQALLIGIKNAGNVDTIYVDSEDVKRVLQGSSAWSYGSAKIHVITEEDKNKGGLDFD